MELGAYMVGYDRASHRKSDPNPHRSLRNEALDVESSPTPLGLGPRFFIIGLSLGGHSEMARVSKEPIEGMVIPTGRQRSMEPDAVVAKLVDEPTPAALYLRSLKPPPSSPINWICNFRRRQSLVGDSEEMGVKSDGSTTGVCKGMRMGWFLSLCRDTSATTLDRLP
ncbi:hypothetical protein QJS10_CPA01g02427 [Acorus calamus]|uniref:Uncharacterized protein n=1 Tax=Acorus calamus TaxID=4465 RepID=A0AAV9FV33_ACOCL|nr:hypothetical protein QJS10_CPA01g02427 [Acorus calamus]